MKKNLIVVHLESTSNFLFEKYQGNMPFICKLKAESLDYQKFYVAATSTLMSTASFLYGNDYQMDHISSFYDGDETTIDPQLNFWKVLKEDGYETFGYFCPQISADELSLYKKRLVWDESCGFGNECPDSEAMKLKVLSTIEENRGQRFAIYIHSFFTHLNYSNKRLKYNNERTAFGFEELDKVVKSLYEQLQTLELLSDTAIVFWGDHGDMYFTKSFGYGVCHALEPYCQMIHTPFFIWNGQSNGRKINQLESSNNCKEIVLNLLNNREDQSKKHNVVFSHNLFYNQRSPLNLNKSYCVLDGRFMLMVSELGVEMYDLLFDYENQNNLLSFFKIRKGELHLIPKFYKAHSHFQNFYTDSDRILIARHFKELKDELSKYIGNKESRLKIRLTSRFRNSLFTKVRSRRFWWLYPINSWERLKTLTEFLFKVTLN